MTSYNDDVTYEITPGDVVTLDARRIDEPRGAIMPVYLVADTSLSMKYVIVKVEEGVADTLDVLESQPMLASKIRFSVQGFNSQAYTILPMCDPRETVAIPELVASGNTSYAAAFRLLKPRIEADVAALKAEGYKVYRPLVFFFSDGNPTDSHAEWKAAHSELTSPAFAAHPNIIAYGIGEADASVIAQVATSRDWAFIYTGKDDLSKAVTDLMEALTHSIIASGSAIAQGMPLQIEKPAGFLTIDVDVI